MMWTKKQQELVDSFVSTLDGESQPSYRDIAACLAHQGYHPEKSGSNISFKHDLHNKQIAKMGARNNKARSPFFALRFSACRGYSQRFADVVSAMIEKYPARAARCVSGGCGYCAGDADTHVYTCTLPGGETKTHCGAYALEIPDIASGDIKEIDELIQEEHEYLMKQEADRR
jgi:hypothetical protein